MLGLAHNDQVVATIHIPDESGGPLIAAKTEHPAPIPEDAQPIEYLPMGVTLALSRIAHGEAPGHVEFLTSLVEHITEEMYL